MITYADGTLIMNKPGNAYRAAETLSKAVEKISHDLQYGGIEINNEKAKCMLVRPDSRVILKKKQR